MVDKKQSYKALKCFYNYFLQTITFIFIFGKYKSNIRNENNYIIL